MNAKRVQLLAVFLAGSALTLSAPARPGEPSGEGGAAPGGKQARAGKPADAAFFEKEVLPILKANCFKCHGGPRPRGGLSLASRKGLLAGGDLGPAVSLDRPGDSLLLSVSGRESRRPLGADS